LVGEVVGVTFRLGTYRIPLLAAAAVVISASPAFAVSLWTSVLVPQLASGGSLNAVNVVSGNDAWAVGFSRDSPTTRASSPLIDHWDGSTWQQLPVPKKNNTEVLNAVSAFSATDAWAVGYSNAQRYQFNPLWEHWNGQSWTPMVGSGAWLVGVVDLGPTNAYAVGNNSTRGYLFHWDGSAWSIVPYPDPNPVNPNLHDEFQAIAASSASDIWALGLYTKAVGNYIQYERYTLHFDGSSWTPIYMPLDPVYSASTVSFKMTSIAALSSSDVWSVGYKIDNSTNMPVATLTMHWNGNAWSIVDSPSPGIQPVLNGVGARGSNDVWAVGSYIPSSGAQSQTLTMHWDGSAWSVQESPNTGATSHLNSVSSRPSSSMIWAVGYSGSSTTQPLAMDHP
jgi:hypothetical protein